MKTSMIAPTHTKRDENTSPADNADSRRIISAIISEICGNYFQMKKLLLLTMLAVALGSCKKETCTDGKLNQNETDVDCGGDCSACPSCSDGIKNQNETDVDCGGSCTACPSCSDGIKNQNETGVDCGGSCSPCKTLSMKINGVLWTAVNVSASINTSWNTLEINANQYPVNQTFTMRNPGNYAVGTYQFGPFDALYYNGTLSYSTYDNNTTGYITFTLFDTVNKKVSGTFYFTGVSQTGTDTLSFTEGEFSNITY